MHDARPRGGGYANVALSRGAARAAGQHTANAEMVPYTGKGRGVDAKSTEMDAEGTSRRNARDEPVSNVSVHMVSVGEKGRRRRTRRRQNGLP